MECKKENNQLKKILDLINQVMEISYDDLDLNFFTDTLQEISGAEFVVLNTISEKNANLMETKAVSGKASKIEVVADIVGFELVGAQWKLNKEHLELLRHNGLYQYQDFTSYTQGQVPTSVTRLLENVFELGETYGAHMVCSQGFTVEFILVFTRDKTLLNREIVSNYINQIATILCRLQEESQLTRRNQEIAMILDNIDIQVWYLKDEITNGYVNSAHAQFFRTGKEQLIDKTIYQLLDEEEAKVCLQGNRQVFVTKRQIKTKEWVKDGTGTMRLLEIIKTPKLNKKGQVDYVVCAARDITEEHKLAQELQENREHLSSVLESLEDIVWSSTVNGERIYMNQVAEAIYGIPVGELLQNHKLLTNMVHPEDSYHTEVAYKRVLNDKKSVNEYRIIRPDGQERWLYDRCKLMCTPDGVPVRIDGITSDITERKQAEEKLTEYNMQLEIKNLEMESLYTQLDNEINKARRIHERTLPKEIPEVNNVSFASHYMPAAMMGGDFYDVRQIGNKLVMYLSDVTGHGLESAMMSSFVKNTINSFLSISKEEDISPDKIVGFLSKQFAKENYPLNFFICIFVAVLDLETNELSHLGPGIQDPPLIHFIGQDREPSELQSGGLPITNTVPSEYLNYQVEKEYLEPGTTIIFTTDGLTEQMVDGKHYKDRLRDIFTKNSNLPPQALKQIINQDFEKFNNNSLQGEDDITYLLLQVDSEDRRKYSFTVPSQIEEIPILCDQIEKLIPKDDKGQRALVGVLELMTNAMEHGNKFDKQKTITVKLVVDPQYVMVHVTDEGQGFDWRNRLINLIEMEGDSERGRGIAMTLVCCDKIYYNQKGNEGIIITF